MPEQQNNEVPDIQLTPEEEKELLNHLTGSAAGSDDKHNVHKFLHDVVVTPDTTRVGFLRDEEVGTPKNTVRTLKELALFCNDVADMAWFGDYFEKMSQIVTSTSLSKNAKLLELAVVSRREIADVSKKNLKPNKGWFKRKEKPDDQ